MMLVLPSHHVPSASLFILSSAEQCVLSEQKKKKIGPFTLTTASRQPIKVKSELGDPGLLSKDTGSHMYDCERHILGDATKQETTTKMTNHIFFEQWGRIKCQMTI